VCGVAGFSRTDDHDGDPSALVRLLIAGLAERGEDACGYAWRTADGEVGIVKEALAPSRFLREVQVELPADAREVLVHVRDHTKGRPSHVGNNHPLRHGRIVGVHNGIIQNDDELFAKLGRDRQVPGASVDSEAIFLLLDALPEHRDAFPHLVGSYATAFLDSADPGVLHVVRGRARPLHLTQAPGITAFASTTGSLRFAAEHGGIAAAPIRAVHAARHLRLVAGEVAGESRIHVRRFTEAPTLRYARDLAHAIDAREHVVRQVGQARTA
jgi:glucosamine 6-phosphate synthetase-like amidotransferase/phosphosugar isomerase protein